MIELYGIRLVSSPLMIKQHNEVVKRSWKERLLSLPWKPWFKTKMVIHYDPDPNLYRMGNSIIGHPKTLMKIINQLPIDTNAHPI